MHKGKKTYSTWDSLVVTDPTTSHAIGGLSMGERTGSRVFHHLWPYVLTSAQLRAYVAQNLMGSWQDRTV
ncbi:hypothetical protein NEUTE2DRAFT_50704 [Neurospora tetrasperma FGSC 2509]|nr:hypothetical protein NEUTE2DRAFT_50704 [Neurospora tetrasperma FGSC 2509]